MINNLVPNLIQYWPEFIESIKQTLYMLTKAGIYSILAGLFFGVILVLTREDGLKPNRLIYSVLDTFVNIFRSIPFVILLTALIPITKIVSNTAIGVEGTIFPLVVGCTPFFVRQVDLSLSEIDRGLIEAAQSMGLSTLQIVIRVYLRESIPSLVRSTTITLISLLGLTTLGGVVGGGGLGDYVIRYGHNKYNTDISIVAVLVILIFVSVIQSVGNFIIKKTSH
ncbi:MULTISPECIES: methionine ABC transporter permease [unclassified Erysipelothrix]|uniref:methionine ABC transporter permease n=1 Tax=unclassified Erysipelothrix TaxID=2624170 RepID=UPI001378D0BC|nr:MULTISPECIES: methionine ABC transporter permease [unclassified Erysipelothrix]MBK2402184.1 ABC transporter permease [Erysipelothrix sp. strain 2 (EsS2-6-Brazil)]MBK2404649.1 ABC transporter permease [Erysipelothrix sp. strain 2 (EsS2-7-Brazil)]NBA01220.1 ABC transporter permease subunit [Erysipelothrix rhusiopathiae]